MAADVTIDLFSLYVLFSHFTPRDGTSENCQIPSYARASRCILIYARFMKRQKANSPENIMWSELEKQNMQAKK